MERMIGLVGIVLLVSLCYVFSAHKERVSFRLILGGIGLQILIALLVLGIPILGINGPLQFLFDGANTVFVKLINFTNAGSQFLFGPLAGKQPSGGILFAFNVLPTIIFFSTLMAIAYYLGIMQAVVNFLAKIMQKSLKISGAESLATAANIFAGQTEAPLVVRPYLSSMTKSELLVLMTGGMATVAGGVLAAFVGMLQASVPDIGGHLLTASVMSAPAAVLAAKLLIPETQSPETLGLKNMKEVKINDANVLEAATRGASEGLKLAANVGAMLLAFIALMAMLNFLLNTIGDWTGFASWGKDLVPKVLAKGDSVKLSFELILGWLFSPIAFLMGIPLSEATSVGAFLGKKIVLNEFIAYLHLSEVASQLSQRSVIITSYALCGFANFSSIGIQVGGIGALVPNRRSDLARLGLRAVLGGSIAAFLTACIAGLLI